MKRKKWVPCIALVVVIFLLKWHSNSSPSALAPIKEYTKSELRPIMTREQQRPTEPGAYGHPFPLTSNTDEGKARIAAGWERHGFNEEVCRKISLHRQINDTLSKGCKQYKPSHKLGKASIIIIFHNEASCTLYRTIYSILETTPAVLLEEIILVDDKSVLTERPELDTELDNYIEANFRGYVKLIRQPERHGLIKARLTGASVACGDVLVFLDAHCECHEHWLIPMMDRIAGDERRVQTPVIENIDKDTFSMMISPASNIQKGVFDWGMTFRWAPAYNAVEKRNWNAEMETKPINSPTMAGGLFAIKKSYFEYLGTYDEEMRVWGGENLEMSFRIWQCGGRIEINPCSRVGHVFRSKSPYTHPGGFNIIMRNIVRLVDVWLDDFGQLFYRKTPEAARIPGGSGDISNRIKLRQQLQCHSFQWYLDNVYPEKDYMLDNDLQFTGSLVAIKQESEPWLCIDAASPPNEFNPLVGHTPIIYPCHGEGSNQNFFYTKRNEVRFLHTTSDLCLTCKNNHIVLTTCSSKVQGHLPPAKDQTWLFDTNNGWLRNLECDACLERGYGEEIKLAECSSHNKSSQRFEWKTSDSVKHFIEAA